MRTSELAFVKFAQQTIGTPTLPVEKGVRSIWQDAFHLDHDRDFRPMGWLIIHGVANLRGLRSRALHVDESGINFYGREFFGL